MATTARPRTGHTVKCSGLDLAVGDYAKHAGVWYRLVEQTDESRRSTITGGVYSRVFRGVTKDGGRRALLLDSTSVVAYRWDR
jgi:hypothetical protein